MEKEIKRKLAIYARTSVDKDDFNTSIEQQIEEGKRFAKLHNLEYEVFSDKGVSAYKIEDEKDPYYTRDNFKKLMNKICENVFTDLWVWETSRLSRNDLATAKIKYSLMIHNVILHTKSQTYDLTKPEDKFTLSMMGSIAELERSHIVERTTRGLYKAINDGKRSFSKFYGYEKSGYENGNYTYKVDERKIEQVKQAYKMFLEGKSLRKISHILEDINLILDTKEILRITSKWGRILAHKEYTGYSLNMDGLKIEKQFSNNEIGSLVQLKDKEKYWVKSKVYKEELISIDDWIVCREKLQIYKNIRNQNKSSYSVNSSLCTGIIKCNVCGSGFFYYETKSKNVKNEKVSTPYYKHRSLFNNKQCSQNPKTIRKEKLDNLLRFFYIFQSLIFNDKQAKSKEILLSIKNQKTNLDKEINNIRKENEKLHKLIKIADESILKNPDLFIEITRQQKLYNEKILENEGYLSIKENELVKLQKEIEENEKLLTFKMSQKNIVDFLFFKNIEEQRNILLTKIDEAKIYRDYIVIKSSGIYFILKVDKNEKPIKNENGKCFYKTYTIPELLYSGKNEEILSFWKRYNNDDLDFKNIDTQNYLRNLFNWKNFIVSDEKIELDVEIKLPENSTVIYFDESETLDEKREKARARGQKYRERLKQGLVNHRK